ncbi:MAG: dihydrofolate reductase family protein, partial [Bacteroidia bacterium]|nr:dihydrofolate reductase family protein [Bacteroidia bacterium]MDW8335223.1 dihydrofolate reductase family protein [Bacteroidia bacterium]
LFHSPPDPVWVVSPHLHAHAQTLAYESDLQRLFARLYDEHRLGAVLVEGGAATHRRLISAGLWDRIYVFASRRRLNLPDPVKAPVLPAEAVLIDEFNAGEDFVRIYEPA